MKVKIKICGVLDHQIMSTISNMNIDYGYALKGIINNRPTKNELKK